MVVSDSKKSLTESTGARIRDIKNNVQYFLNMKANLAFILTPNLARELVCILNIFEEDK